MVGVLVVAAADLEGVPGGLPEEQLDEELGLVGRRREELPQHEYRELLQFLVEQNATFILLIYQI